MQNSGSSVMEKQCEWTFFRLLVFIMKSRRYMGLGSNVTVEWLALTLCIREIPGSILRPEADYPDRLPQSHLYKT